MNPTAVPQSMPAPVGGWNARDSLAEMGGTDAVILTNWFPSLTECVLRNGYTQYSTGLSGQVETLMAYSGGSVNKLFGVAGGNIYDCTAGGAVGAAAVTTLGNSRFQYVNFATPGGQFLLAVNGADKMRYFDGTTWSADGGTYTVTNADTSTWVSICLHKQRVWAVQKGTLKAWYLPTGSIAGAAQLFDLSAFFRLGGQLMAVETWTLDGGDGVDDYLVFISSKGEVLVYYGPDPATLFAMKGLYRIGSPVGNRCLFKFAGDLLAITQDGLVPMSKALQSERVDPRVSISDKIYSAISNSVSLYGSTFGWQLLNFPKANQLILNVPVALGSQQQYVMNTISGAWCNFTGWGANCWELFNDMPYFGGNGIVGAAWNGQTDNGANITSDALQAFSAFGQPGRLKKATMMRPIFRSSNAPSVRATVSADFNLDAPTSPISYTAPTNSLWDSVNWDAANWAGGLKVFQSWRGANALGYYLAPRIATVSQNTDLRWASTDLVLDPGAIL